MALFKIKRGLAADLPTSYVEGYCYVTTDDGKFYIDTSNSAAGRIVLNAAKADKATALATSRSLQTNLASTTAASFNGSGNASIGVTGTLAVGNGGTGKTSWTKYGLVYASASTTLASLGVGTSGYVLQSNGTTTAPTWINATNSNTASTIVKRDSNGNFSAGTITATLAGSASRAKLLETWTSDISSTYGTNYPLYAYWQTGSVCRLTVDDYTVGVDTADTFSSAASVALTGDVTGTASSTKGWSVATTLAKSGVTAGSYGPSANASPAHGGSFSVPYITFDDKGRATAASTRTITLPADNNTHYTANLLLGASGATATSTTAVSNPYIILRENGTNRNQIQIKGGTNVTVSGDDGIITINSSYTDTNTHYTTKIYAGASGTTSNSTSAVSNPYLTVVDDTTYRAQVRFVGSGGTSISANGGTITISSSTYTLPTASTTLGGVKTTSTVTSTSGYTACPIIGGVVYYKDTNTHAVSSVNGKTGAVSLTYSDVGAAKSSHNHTWSNISDRASCTINTSGTITGSKVYGAVWNDYAEYRWVLKDKATDKMPEPGRCVVENGNDSMSISNGRLQPGAKIISDTYGMCMGETEKAKTPIAVCGRVLAHPFERKIAFNVGDAVCSGPNGTVSRMTREEIMMYPERIVGTVVSKPTYKEWGPNKIPVNGRIWIQVK